MFAEVKANAGVLTNFEVVDLLNSRGTSNDTTRFIAPIARSEYKVYFDFSLKNGFSEGATFCFVIQMILQVYDYLNETASSTQTLESVTTFSDKCKDFNLEKLRFSISSNIRPSIDAKALIRSGLIISCSYTTLFTIIKRTYVCILSYGFSYCFNLC